MTAAAQAGFIATALERRYAFVDDCPPALFGAVVTLPIGTLEARTRGARLWHDALLGGSLPDPGTWPGHPVDAPVRSALASMGVARFCKGQPELVEALMRDILVAFARQSESFQSEVAARLAELEALERARLEETQRALNPGRRHREVKLDAHALERLLASARREVSSHARDPDAELLAAWGERARAWASIADVFGDLGEMLGRGWDMSLGVLKHVGWLDLLRLQALLENLPELREVIRALGRLHATDAGPSIAETILVPVRRLEEERQEVRTPHVPTETHGIERSGEIGRMLPAEASMLSHPKLRLVWHARRAGRALLTYRLEGVALETIQAEREVLVETKRPRPRPERGPIIAIVDTSGSMHGLPEQIAKAIVLEAARTAHDEKRACYLYAYSGPGQVIEHALSLSPDGLGSLLSFLALSFGGGNDESGMMARVVSRLAENDWRKADVVFVSDGQWPAPPPLVDSVQQARAQGTRFHGVQVGRSGQTGLHQVCDPVHVFQDWAAAGGWRRPHHLG